MKRFLIFLTFFTIHLANGQKFNLKIEGKTGIQNKIIDSLNYTKSHINIASILKAKKSFDSILIKNGYIESALIEQKKINDSSFVFYYDIGNKNNILQISFTEISNIEKELLQLRNDSLIIPLYNTEKWITDKLKLLENKGFALAKLQLSEYQISNHKLFAKLNVKLNNIRTVNELIILGYDKFPKNLKKNFEKKIKKQLFNKNLVNRVFSDFNSLPFVNQIKYPEILFTNNATKLYTYLEKTRPNKFDGFIGFANDEKSNLVFNGYIDLQLQNILNSGERFNLYWKNDGNRQTSFNIGTELPYLFKSEFGVKANLKIFKQDSLFQNTQRDLNVGYYFSFNKKLFLGYQSTTSVDIQNQNNFSLNNYKNHFFTSIFNYTKRDNTNILFPQKTSLYIKGGIGNRTIENDKKNQQFIQFDCSHNFYLNEQNSIYVKNETFYLNSDSFIINELYRFGGINSIRGFRENSLQANFFSGFITEYRYNMNELIYLHSVLDYGYFQDKSSNSKNKLLGIGFGFGIKTNNGLFNFVYSNGSIENQQLKLSNSIFQMSFNTFF